VKTPRITAFTASGTFTPAAGVTYAVAYIRGGGGGVGTDSSGSGGNSSVAFAGGTITATGGNLDNSGGSVVDVARAGVANSGEGAFTQAQQGGAYGWNAQGGNGAEIVAGGAVTPGTGITVTVGAGGTAGTSGAAGGSGYVYIETYE
jgi:hypothetical protein